MLCFQLDEHWGEDEGEAEEDLGVVARGGDVSIIRDRNSAGETFQFLWRREAQVNDSEQTSAQSAALTSQSAFDAFWAALGSPRSGFYSGLSTGTKAEWKAQSAKLTSSTGYVCTYQTAEHWTVGPTDYATLRAATGTQAAFDTAFSGIAPPAWYAALPGGVQAAFRARCGAVAL